MGFNAKSTAFVCVMCSFNFLLLGLKKAAYSALKWLLMKKKKEKNLLALSLSNGFLCSFSTFSIKKTRIENCWKRMNINVAIKHNSGYYGKIIFFQ